MEKELTERLLEFLRRYYEDEVATLAQRYPKEQQSLSIDYKDLWQYDPAIADDLQNHPQQILNYLEQALANFDLPVDVDLSDARARIYNLPETIDVAEVSRTSNLGNLVAVSAQVEKVTKVKPRVEEAAFECQRCGTQTVVSQPTEQIQEPHECQGCERQGPFRLKESKSEFTDYQVARLQQPPERASGGSGPGIDMELREDLIKEIEAGDRVTATGILELKDDLRQNKKTTFNLQLRGNAVETEESDYEDIEVEDCLDEIRAIANGEQGDPYDLLIDSINPEHKGDRHIKLAIALQLFGGWSRVPPSGSRIRGDSHMLLIGGPGCGKSSFLEAVDSIAPRSTYASGKGASAPGLTAAAVPDDFGDTEWSLQAGALVLADGGIACIDEIDKVKEDAVSSMHDALEGQQVRVNKAGINARLRARTALLAAGNPRDGRFDEFEPIAQQIDLTPTLLSRFDLIFLVRDRPDEERDREVIEHMRRARRAASKQAHEKPLTDEERESVEPAIERDLLRAYIAHAREACEPVLLDEEAEQYLTDEFQALRQANDEDGPVPVTYRSLEAVERLAEASARVRLDDEVRVEDVERAFNLVKKSMRQVGIDPDSNEFDADVVETGQSMSQRERRKAIIEVLESKDDASLEELDEMLDISRKKLESAVESLKKRAQIYEPEEGVLRTL